MVSAQVSNTSENLYGSDLCLLHCLLWLFLGCWFCPHNIIFYFFPVPWLHGYEVPIWESMKRMQKAVRGLCVTQLCHSTQGLQHTYPGKRSEANDLAPVILFSQTHLWQCSSQIIAISHLLLLMQLPVLRKVTTARDHTAAYKKVNLNRTGTATVWVNQTYVEVW